MTPRGREKGKQGILGSCVQVKAEGVGEPSPAFPTLLLYDLREGLQQQRMNARENLMAAHLKQKECITDVDTHWATVSHWAVGKP